MKRRRRAATCCFSSKYPGWSRRSVRQTGRQSATIAPTVTAADASPRLIVVEDSELDYELLIAMLIREGLRPRAIRAEDEAGMRDAFAQGPVDAVITDHNLPRFDSFA